MMSSGFSLVEQMDWNMQGISSRKAYRPCSIIDIGRGARMFLRCLDVVTQGTREAVQCLNSLVFVQSLRCYLCKQARHHVYESNLTTTTMQGAQAKFSQGSGRFSNISLNGQANYCFFNCLPLRCIVNYSSYRLATFFAIHLLLNYIVLFYLLLLLR